MPPIEKRQYFQQLLPPPPMPAIIWITSPQYFDKCSRRHYLVCAFSIFLQPLTPSTTTYYSKDCLPGFGFRPTGTALLWIQSYPSSRSISVKTSEHHPNHALSAVVFRKVQFLVPSCSSFTLLHSVHSSKHPQLTIAYTPNYSSPSLQTASPNS